MNDQNDRAELTPEELQELRERKQEYLKQLQFLLKYFDKFMEILSDEIGHPLEFGELEKIVDEISRNPDSVYFNAIQRAAKICFSAEREDDPEDSGAVNAAEIKKNDIAPLTRFLMGLDKVNSTLWNEKTPNALYVDTSESGKKGEASIYVSVDFSALNKNGVKVDQTLTEFDNHVYNAIASLYAAGNHTVSITQIAHAMGYSNPDGKTLENIKDIALKMMRAIIEIDNTEEAGIYNYPKIKVQTQLIQATIIAAEFHGKKTDHAIQLNAMPILLKFAIDRNQYTAFSPKLNNAPIDKTPRNIAIANYLKREIAKIKNGHRTNKILYDTLFKACNITRNKNREKDKVKRYLEYYKECGFVKDFTITDDFVIIE